MPKTIVQKVVFTNTTLRELYTLYMNEKLHAQLTGAAVKISQKIGSSFSAHGNYISGKNIHLVKDRLIVQTWRAVDWDKKEADSIFMISLEQKGKNVMLHAVHTNLPDKAAAGIDKGWHDFYWSPWKQYLASKPVKSLENK